MYKVGYYYQDKNISLPIKKICKNDHFKNCTTILHDCIQIFASWQLPLIKCAINIIYFNCKIIQLLFKIKYFYLLTLISGETNFES
jgi:hypothetical protein